MVYTSDTILEVFQPLYAIIEDKREVSLITNLCAQTILVNSSPYILKL